MAPNLYFLVGFLSLPRISSFSFTIFNAASETLVVLHRISCFPIFSSSLKYRLEYFSRCRRFSKEFRYCFSTLADLHKEVRSWDNVRLVNGLGPVIVISWARIYCYKINNIDSVPNDFPKLYARGATLHYNFLII